MSKQALSFFSLFLALKQRMDKAKRCIHMPKPNIKVWAMIGNWAVSSYF